jgi:hypothetical protein
VQRLVKGTVGYGDECLNDYADDRAAVDQPGGS